MSVTVIDGKSSIQTKQKKLLPSARVAERYDVTVRSIDRWVAEGDFPKPTHRFTNRNYWSEDVLDAFDDAHATESA